MTGSRDLPKEIAEAEKRLGRTLPDDWKAALANPPPNLPEELLAPSQLVPLTDPEFKESYSSLPEESRAQIIPFCPDGMGNYAAFYYAQSPPSVIDLDHETGGDNALDHQWKNFTAWAADLQG